MRRTIVAVLLAAFFVGITTAQDPLTNEVIRLVNDARSAAGVNVLYANDQLTTAAQTHSNDMATTGALTHVGSDNSQFWERAARAGYAMVNGAQNVLARNDLSALNTVTQWQSSSANNANLVNAQYQEVGFAYARGSNGTYYYTLLLGTRADFAVPTTAPVFGASVTPLPLPNNTGGLLAPSATPIMPTIIATAFPSPTRDPLILTITSPLPASTLDPRPTRTPDPFATIAPIPTATPIPLPDIRLFISPTSVVIQNTSGSSLDFSGLRFESEFADLEAERFDNGFLTTSLFAFPSGDCVEVWGLEVKETLPRASQCRTRHGWIVVNDASSFWKGVTQFSVLRDGVVVGYCAVNPNQPTICDITFSAPSTGGQVVVQQPTRTSSSAVVNEGVVRLLVDESNVTLLNLTGNTLDVSGYTFEGNGTFAAQSWLAAELSRPLDALPSGDCLQAWSPQIEILARPSSCRYRHGWVSVRPEDQFWVDSSFTVFDRGRALGSCAVGQAVCDLQP